MTNKATRQLIRDLEQAIINASNHGYYEQAEALTADLDYLRESECGYCAGCWPCSIHKS